MTFSNTFVKKTQLPGGIVIEQGTFNSDSVTTGTITADVTINPVITNIFDWSFASDGDHAVTPARDVNLNQVKITTTSGDTGDYTIWGFVA